MSDLNQPVIRATLKGRRHPGPKEGIWEKEQRLKKLKSDIWALENQIEPLRRQEKSLKKQIAALRPKPNETLVERLPTEALGRIFEFIAPNHFDQFDETSCNECQSALRALSRTMLVCKRWYNLAISNPRLWNNICLRSPENDAEKDVIKWAHSRWPKYIVRFSKRWKNAPLDINVDFTSLYSSDIFIENRLDQAFGLLSVLRTDEDDDPVTDWDGPSMDACHSIYCRVFIELFGRVVGKKGVLMANWRSLRLGFPWEPTMREGIKNLLGEAPRLERLLLFGPPDETRSLDDDDNSHQLTHLSYPSLELLAIRYPVTLADAPQCPNISTLHLDYMESWDGIDRLNEFSQVKYLRLMVGYDALTPVSIPTIFLPQLRRLHISAHAFVHFLPVLESPTLEKLTIQDTARDAPSSFPDSNVLGSVVCLIFLHRTPLYMEFGFTPPEDDSDAEDERLERRKRRIEMRLQSEQEVLTGRLDTLVSQLTNVEVIGTEMRALDAMEKVVETHKKRGMLLKVQSVDLVDEFGSLPSSLDYVDPRRAKAPPSTAAGDMEKDDSSSDMDSDEW